jgi:hypothetical protein
MEDIFIQLTQKPKFWAPRGSLQKESLKSG